MLTRTIAYYEARIAFGLASLLPLLLLPGYTLAGWIVWASRSTPPLREVTWVAELALTLSGGLAAAHLMTIEREEGFDEIRRTYPERSWRIPLLRAIEAATFITVSGLAAGFFLYLAYGDYDFYRVVLPAFAPALYLCGMALLINNVSGNYWIAAAVVVAYWFGDFQSQGYYTLALFLFNHSMPLPQIDPGVNRALLLAGALVFFGVNTAFSLWRRRGTVGR